MSSNPFVAGRYVLLWIAIATPVAGHIGLRLVHERTERWTLSAAKAVEKSQNGHQAFYTLMDAASILRLGFDAETLVVTVGALAGIGAFAGFRSRGQRPNQASSLGATDATAAAGDRAAGSRGST